MTVLNFIKAMKRDNCEPENYSDIIPNKGAVYYQLKGDKKKNRALYALIENADGFMCGYARNFKTGDCCDWHSKINRQEMSPNEIRASKRDMGEAIKELSELKEKEYERISLLANKVWRESKPIDLNFPYIKEKGITPTTGRFDYNGDLILSAVKNGKIHSLQTIYKNGFKKFMKGGRITGCYHPIIKKHDDKSIFIICEGYATGESIKEATKNYPVLVAFMASNLLPVAKEVRVKYPDAKIIIAGDSDKWRLKKGSSPKDIDGDDPKWGAWRAENALENIGKIKADIASAEINGFAIFPDVADDDKLKRTDFNDVHRTDGLEAIKRSFKDILQIMPSIQEDRYSVIKKQENIFKYSDMTPVWDSYDIINQMNWKKRPDDNNPYGTPQSGSNLNILLHLRHNKDFQGVFRYDKFSQNILLSRCPPWESAEDFQVRPVRDTDYTNLQEQLEQLKLMIGFDSLKKAVRATAEKNWFHPMQALFEGLKWDGFPRLDDWLYTYFGATTQDRTYLATIGRRWLISGVARIYVHGSKVDTMLVLEGSQGQKKSSGLKCLTEFYSCNIEDVPFTNNVTFRDLNNKDALMIMRGKLIVEFAELDGLSPHKVDEAKNWMTRDLDEYRAPYDSVPMKHPRQCILAGTVNGYEWQPDVTGGRRYLPVLCSGDMDIEALKKDREQLWAEAIFYYKSGEKWWYDKDDPTFDIIDKEQKKRIQADVWEEIIEDYACNLKYFTTLDTLRALDIPVRDMTERMKKRIDNILIKLGYEKKPRTINGRSKRAWGLVLKKKFEVAEETEEEEIEF